MTSHAVAAARTDSRIERYWQAESALWNRYGLDLTERFVELDQAGHLPRLDQPVLVGRSLKSFLAG